MPRTAVQAALAAAAGWRALDFDSRAAILLRAADLLAGPWRARMNAATMLGQAKTALPGGDRLGLRAGRLLAVQRAFRPADPQRAADRQLEGDLEPHRPPAARGLRLRRHAVQLHRHRRQPADRAGADGQRGRLEAVDHPATGGVVDHGPAAGGRAAARGDQHAARRSARRSPRCVLAHPELAGIHFTGSTRVFQQLWSPVGANIAGYRSYPRLVGETGGKDFVVAHPSADVDVLRTALVRGAFEYSGQKCSAASRSYVPASLWPALKDGLIAETEALDHRFRRGLRQLHQRRHRRPVVRPAEGRDRPGAGHGLASRCWPAAATTTPSATSSGRPCCSGTDPRDEIFCNEYFGPILSIHVYPDDEFASVLDRGRRRVAVRADRLDHRPGPGGGGARPPRRCGSPPATSTSTTSPPARSSVSSRSAARGRRAPTTRPAPRPT